MATFIAQYDAPKCTQEEIAANPFGLNGYQLITNQTQEAVSKCSQNAHAATLAFHLVQNCFVMVSAFNIEFREKTKNAIENSKIIFTSYPINTHEFCVNHNIIVDKSKPIPTSKNDFKLIQEQGVHIGDLLDKFDRINNVKQLQNKNPETAANILNALKRMDTQKDKQNASNAIMKQKYIDSNDWLMNQLKKSLTQKLLQRMNKSKSKFKCRFKMIPLHFVRDKIGVFHNETKINLKCDLGWDSAYLNFDSGKRNGNCPNWLWNVLLNNGQPFKPTTKNKQTHKYYNCQIKYQANKGTLTFACRLKHLNPGSTVWQ